MRTFARWSVSAILIALHAPVFATAPERPKIEFNREIRPILAENCYACHGPDQNRRKANLRLDERASALTLGAIVPGNPEESALVERIFSEDADLLMPPPETRKSLTPAQRQLLREWIEQGAEYQDHWAYVPPRRLEPPPVKNSAWVRNPIDAFILRKLEERGLAPSPEADRSRLIRRLTLDLLGLPPTLEEVQSFENDPDPDAYEKLVDRLLRSPHYGERMAVPWLDVVRFADTVGYHGDQNQRIFPYRDYVIDSFNKNKPFDQFTIEQLAGDLLPKPTEEALVATGFNRLNMMTREGGAQPAEYLAKYAADRVRTVSIAWLGSTMGCAECHDHKYDPFTQRDFYSLAAFFADVKQWGVYSDYEYTPNPDLKGWSNDHPFPPEITVESPYLKVRQQRLREQIRAICRGSGSLGDRVDWQGDGLDPWLAELRQWVVNHPSGWMVPEVEIPETATRQPDGSVLLGDPALVADDSKLGSDWVFRFRPGLRWLSRIRLELLPHAAHGGKIVRGDSETTVVRVSASLKPVAQPQRDLGFFYAAADHSEPRYANGFEVLGVQAGWWTSREHKAERQTSIWFLDRPVRLEADDELIVRVQGARLGCVRVSVSPFGFDPQGRWELTEQQRLALARSAAEWTDGERDDLVELAFFSTGGSSEKWEIVKSLCRDLLECRDGTAVTMVTQSVPPRLTRVLPRGNWQDESGPVVEPAVPQFLPQPMRSTEATGRLTRLDLAHWITAPDNPLTARVFMNRLWKQFFGTGISSLVEDVGAQGEWPVHPELLDWLACEFRDSGWDVKRMVKLLVTSATYRQDSRARPELTGIDPNNRLLAFHPPRRLEAEFVRDNALAIADLINLDIGGPSVFPYQPPGYYANLQFPDRDYVASRDERQYRRGVYMHWQRTFLHPMLANFDAPSREECTASRNLANTPQQALTLLNDPTFVEAARGWATKLLDRDGGSDAERIQYVFRKALARSPSLSEQHSLEQFLAVQRQAFRESPSEAERLLGVGHLPPPSRRDPVEVAAWTAVCRVVLNLHETITRY